MTIASVCTYIISTCIYQDKKVSCVGVKVARRKFDDPREIIEKLHDSKDTERMIFKNKKKLDRNITLDYLFSFSYFFYFFFYVIRVFPVLRFLLSHWDIRKRRPSRLHWIRIMNYIRLDQRNQLKKKKKVALGPLKCCFFFFPSFDLFLLYTYKNTQGFHLQLELRSPLHMDEWNRGKKERRIVLVPVGRKNNLSHTMFRFIYCFRGEKQKG